MNVFISPFQNPFLNLALEDYFLRGGTRLPVLFFYVNRPCVVLGRFQNPWLECHLPYLVEKDIWMVRRQSGGGCVFHDEGNLNFSFITTDPLINRRKHAELLQEAFRKAEIPLEISPRHDLWLEGRKISGSAFKQTKDGSFHHGTFLVSSNLDTLEECLRHTLVPSSTKSIASVRSKVITLQERFPGTEISDVIEIVTHYLGTIRQEIDGRVLSHPQVQESFRHLRSNLWLWGETPAFSLGSLEIPKGSFTRELMEGKLTENELAKYFPDFHEQQKTSEIVF